MHGALGLLVVLALLQAGCEFPFFLADALVPSMTRPEYPLEPAHTVILVDDLQNQLGNPQLAAQIAQRIGYDLVKGKGLKEEFLVPQREVHRLRAQLGEEFVRTPVDRVGREVGARQVIHVDIISATLEVEPSVLLPSVTASVKVIDAQASKRVYPPADSTTNLPGMTTSQRGRVVNVQLSYHIQRESGNGDQTLLMQKLADALGQDIAKLFYRHIAEERGNLRER